MDEKFLRERVRDIQLIADMADPFTKKRLLALAHRYEGGVPRPSHIPIPVKGPLPGKAEQSS